MDGTLCRCTEKGRRNDFFCRKGYPCINVQLDSRNRTVTFETPWNRLNARNRECRFDRTADMIQFVNTLGVPREQLCHAEKPVKEKGYTRITLTCRQPLGNTFFLQYRIYADHGLHKYRCSRIGVITTLVDTANAAQYYLPPMRLWPWQTRTG